MRPGILIAWPAVVLAGRHTFSIANWQGYFNSTSGVLQSFSPAVETTYDFSPTDYFHLRSSPGNYHTGDLTMSWRLANSSAWQLIDSAVSRNTPPTNSKAAGSLLHSNFVPVFPAAAAYMNISRDWLNVDGDLVLSYTIANHASSPTVEIGAFGFPLEFNNIFTNRTAEATHELCNLIDPYIGLHAGYAQVTRLTGTGPNMVITPASNASKFEAWNFLDDTDQYCSYQSTVFEGLYAWQTLTLAYAENEWASADPWMVPTSQTLDPGQSVTFALRFSVSSQVSDIESVVAANGLPVAVGIPGYIIPAGMNTSLYLNYNESVESITVNPEGALTFATASVTNSAWKGYTVKQGPVSTFGRARVTIEYADGKTQAVSYYLVNSGPQTLEGFSDFLFTKQWFAEDDPYFHRSPSIISYDYGTQSQVLQEYRAWIAGISDEAGAGPFEAAAMKTSVSPVASQVYQLEQMVNQTVYQWLQNEVANGTENPPYSVKRSLFFYQPGLVPADYYNSSIDFGGTWDQSDSYDTWRAYDYVHVSALYWGLYSAENQSPGILKLQNQTWYLLMAYTTVMEVFADYKKSKPVTYYGGDGLMCETVWSYILNALKLEGFSSQFRTMQAAMKSRQAAWSNEKIPYGSEMAWDSTGEEGVYLWAKYFNNTALVTRTIQTIRGYMPTVPHWGWNGCARRYWDFTTGGSLATIERMIHHYGSGLNALPLLDSYKYNPTPSNLSAIYDLRVAYGGNMGPLSNINDAGFGSQAFHSFPETLKWENYSGDYGPNFLGHILGACTFLVDHPDFGMISFGGNIVSTKSNAVQVQPVDTVRQRIYIAPEGLAVQINAGVINSFTYQPAAKTVVVQIGTASGQTAKTALLTYEDTIGTGVSLVSTEKRGPANTYRLTLPATLTFKA